MITVTIISPNSGDVPGGGTFETYGFVSVAIPGVSVTAVVKRQDTVIQEGTSKTKQGYDWAFDFSGLPTGLPLRLVVEAVSQEETGIDQRSITCVS